MCVFQLNQRYQKNESEYTISLSALSCLILQTKSLRILVVYPQSVYSSILIKIILHRVTHAISLNISLSMINYQSAKSAPSTKHICHRDHIRIHLATDEFPGEICLFCQSQPYPQKIVNANALKKNLADQLQKLQSLEHAYEQKEFVNKIVDKINKNLKQVSLLQRLPQIQQDKSKLVDQIEQVQVKLQKEKLSAEQLVKYERLTADLAEKVQKQYSKASLARKQFREDLETLVQFTDHIVGKDYQNMEQNYKCSKDGTSVKQITGEPYLDQIISEIIRYTITKSNTLRRVKEQCQNRVKSLLAEVQRNNKKIVDELTTNIEKLEGQKQGIRKELVSWKSKCDEIYQNFKSKQKQLESQKARHQIQLMNCEHEIESLKGRLKLTMEDLSSACKKSQIFNDQARDLRLENQKLMTSVEFKWGQIVELNQTIQDLKAKQEKQLQIIQDYEVAQKYQRLQRDRSLQTIKQLREQLNETMEIRYRIFSDKQSLREKLAQLTKETNMRIEELVAQKEERERTIEQIKAEFQGNRQQMSTTIANLRQTIQEERQRSTTQITNLRSQTKYLIDSLQDTKFKLESEQMHHAETNQKLSSAHKEIFQLQAANNQLKLKQQNNQAEMKSQIQASLQKQEQLNITISRLETTKMELQNTQKAYRYDYVILPHSKILRQSSLPNFKTMLDAIFFERKMYIGQSQLIYRSNGGGLKPSEYHQACDGKHNLLTILLSNNQKIFGGFNPLPVQPLINETLSSFSSQSFQTITESNSPKEKIGSFLFNQSGTILDKNTPKSTSAYEKAYGPMFGYDFIIYDKKYEFSFGGLSSFGNSAAETTQFLAQIDYNKDSDLGFSMCEVYQLRIQNMQENIN